MIASAGQANWCKEHALLCRMQMKGLFCRVREVGTYLLREARLAVRVCASGGDGADLVCGHLEHHDVCMSFLMLPTLCSQMPLTQPQRHSKGMLHLQTHPNLCLAASIRDISWVREGIYKANGMSLACGIIRAENVQSHEDSGMASHHAPRWGG